MGLTLFESYMVSLPSPKQLIMGLSANQGQESYDLHETRKKYSSTGLSSWQRVKHLECDHR